MSIQYALKFKNRELRDITVKRKNRKVQKVTHKSKSTLNLVIMGLNLFQKDFHMLLSLIYL